MSTDESSSNTEPDGEPAGTSISAQDAKTLIDEDGGFRDEVLKSCEHRAEYQLTSFATVEILYYPPFSEMLYRVTEPELTNLEEVVRTRVMRDIEQKIQTEPIETMDDEERIGTISEMAETEIDNQRGLLAVYGNQLVDWINTTADDIEERIDNETVKEYVDGIDLDGFASLDADNVERIMYYVQRDINRYEKLTPMMNDPNIEDISCNSPEVPVFVYHTEHQDMVSNVTYAEDELNSFVGSLAQKADKHVSIAEPELQGRLPNGSRMQLTFMNEISPSGSNFTIRKFKDEPFTPVDLVDFETFSLEQMAYLWLSVQHNKSLIFAGGTASGKTASMNAVSQFIPPRSKIVSIEDTREISLEHSNWVKSVTRDSFGRGDTGKIEMYDLLRDALRQRPEYIIVGEVRGEEAQTLFQAMSTGHTAYSTMHADDPAAAIHRLENAPINLPRQMLESLDIMSIQSQTQRDGDIVRRNQEIVEIVGVDADTQEVQTRTIYEYEPEEDNLRRTGAESLILREIQRELGLTQAELSDELENRRRVLSYIRENFETYDYRYVTEILNVYMQEPELILSQVRNGTLELE